MDMRSPSDRTPSHSTSTQIESNEFSRSETESIPASGVEYISEGDEILSEWACCGITLVHQIANTILEKYDKYWDNTHGFLGVAVVLDPRFKMFLIGFYYKQIYEEKLGHEMTEDIHKRCYDLLPLYQTRTNKNRSESTTSSNPSKPPTTYLKCKNWLSEFDSYRDNLKKAKTSHVKSELEYYLKEEELPIRDGENFDILVWWKSNGLKYHTLQAIARDVLAVPVSNVASESAFSTSSRVVLQIEIDLPLRLWKH